MATSSSTLTQLPYDQRHWAIQYANEDGSVGETRYPINYDELYNLKGRLLTLADATFVDPQQRKAFKDLTWQTLQAWMSTIEADGTWRDEAERLASYDTLEGQDA